MKIIFSRKGLDSSFGKLSSAVLPDGTLYWLPIYDHSNDDRLPNYGDIEYCNVNAEKLISELSDGDCSKYLKPHIDPDIYSMYLPRADGWKAAFGQSDSAQGHLENEQVSVGDIFLFFAWFRSASLSVKGYKYDKYINAHIINGWLQIGEIIKPEVDNVPSWLNKHPHIIRNLNGVNNTIYVAADNLTINGVNTSLPAAGYFSKISDDLVLTADGKSRSNWRLPKWFYPTKGRKPMSYHGDMRRWTICEDCVMLKSVDKGQEFVLDCDYYPEAAEWLKNLLESQNLNGNLCGSADKILNKVSI